MPEGSVGRVGNGVCGEEPSARDGAAVSARDDGKDEMVSFVAGTVCGTDSLESSAGDAGDGMRGGRARPRTGPGERASVVLGLVLEALEVLGAGGAPADVALAVRPGKRLLTLRPGDVALEDNAAAGVAGALDTGTRKGATGDPGPGLPGLS